MFRKKNEKRFDEELVQNSQHGLIYILVDRQTGVRYLHTWNPQGSGLTPLLDANGKVVVKPIEESDQDE